MRAPETYRESRAAAQDDVLGEVSGVHAGLLVRARTGHVVLAARRLQHRPLPEDEAEAEEGQRRQAIVIVALGPVADGARRAEPEPPSAVPCSATWRVSHHWKTVPIDTAVLDTRKICGEK